MGCSNCGSAANGKPSGCKSNGGCSTGGCNRLNVHDWLSSLPLHDGAKPYPIVELSFSKGSRKEFFRNNTHYILEKGDYLAVEGVSGFDIGQVSLTGELVKLQMKKYSVTENSVTKRVLHPATEEELEASIAQKSREPEILIRSRAIAKTLELDMKLCEVEVQADGKKGTFFYTADQRVDFRELIKFFASDFKMKVEMKQIGARQESGKVGGIGSCGRELCCSTWLTDFKSVNTTAARYQNLSINQTKLSGQCGRLKCCLNYELDTYMDALSVFPDHVESLETEKGIAHLQKRDIFKNLMWYSYSDNNKQYPLTIERVKEIQKMNKAGQKAGELQPVELEIKHDKEGVVSASGFVNDVGQITLRSLEKGGKKKNKGGSGNKPQGNRPAGEGGRPAQEGGKPRNQGGGQPQQGNRQGNKGDQQPRRDQPKQGGQPNNANRPPRPQNDQTPRPQGDVNSKPQAEQGGRPQGDRPNNNNRPPNQQRERGPKPNQPDRQNKPASPSAPADGAPQAEQQKPRPPRDPQMGNGQNKPQQQRPNNRNQQRNRPPQGGTDSTAPEAPKE